MWYGREVKHHTVGTKYQYYEVEGTEKPFSSMDELIAYYQKSFLSTEEELLTIPCPRPTLMKQPPPVVEGSDVMYSVTGIQLVDLGIM